MSIEKKCVDCSIIIVDEWFLACKGFMCEKVISYNCVAAPSKKLLSKFPNEVKKGMKCILDNMHGLSWFCVECNSNMKELYSKFDTLITRIGKAEENLNNAVHALSMTPKVNNMNELHSKLDTSTKRVEAELTLNNALHALSTAPKVIDERRVTRSQSKPQQTPMLPLPTTSALLAPPSSSTSSTSLAVTTTTLGESYIAFPSSLTTPSSAGLSPMIDIEPPAAHIPMEVTCNSNIRIVNDNGSHDVITIVKPRRLLFVSRLHKSTTVQTMQNYLMNTFNLPSAYCIKLIPRPKNGVPCDHSSFRISIPANDFERVLSHTLWPKGILIKEFEFMKRSSFRVPPNSLRQT